MTRLPKSHHRGARRASRLESLVTPALLRQFDGKMSNLAMAMGAGNVQALTRAIRTDKMNVEQSLRLARATNVPPVAILHAVGKHAIADLVLHLFGPERRDVLSPVDEEFLRLDHAHRRAIMTAVTHPTTTRKENETV